MASATHATGSMSCAAPWPGLPGTIAGRSRVPQPCSRTVQNRPRWCIIGQAEPGREPPAADRPGHAPWGGVTAMSHLAGSFLLAKPVIHDAHFKQSVVLLVQHGPEGAFGLVVNRPAEVE